ncbi:PDZ domain-containing protein [Sutcliffiella rhizosphaerae]|uniref:Cell division topological determinant MinJ n=1 Tax=Sutcliffiella rhizosphaerae TaxID=2880967 RepID=A0ABM8YN84_9BACI|nr:PDZ domain-containing protein [Sutcliffiella rhizosphaerae]CAG9621454.1 Cell division topological determinant MinJ [Sutcliffiella rhizosphaerae]
MESWVFELLKGVGRLFIHPVLYVTLAVAVVLGYFRVKRERYDFLIRIEYGLTEFQKACKSLLIGIALSVFTIGIGVILPFGTIVLLGLFTILFTLFIKPRLLSSAYIFGFAFLGVILLPNIETSISLLQSLFVSIAGTDLSTLALLMGMLIVVEGLLVWKQASFQTSPMLHKSKRGLPVGSHVVQRVWILPLFLFVPVTSGGITTYFDWWPVLQVGEHTLTIWLVPFAVGFYQHLRASLPKVTIPILGKQLFFLGLLVFLISASSLLWATSAIIAAIVAIFGRGWLQYRTRIQEDRQRPLFVQRDDGLVILGVIPDSPAEKMNLQIGEIITKVNNIPVKTVPQFYEALQKNRAFCKLHVVDINGEIRFAQSALYEGDHHELGLLFIQEGRKWKRAEVS